MPRQKRLDAPGILHHVVTRGIEKTEIFKDSVDREEFLTRLAVGLEKTGCQCYAWSLMPNHLHLLIRTGRTSLSDLMSGLLTGYAQYFNRKRRRHGHLFQNRYKSILCQEDVYFLELVRYIHLNPLRSGLVSTLHKLGKYPWTGHAVLIGKMERKWQCAGEVLSWFASQRRVAMRKYREFVREGMGMGGRSDLTGGGLRRRAGGWEGVRALKGMKEYWQGDERILGDGEFVNRVLKVAGEEMKKKEKLLREGWTLDRLLAKVCEMLKVDPDDLKKKGRESDLSRAQGLIAYWGYHELGIPGSELIKLFDISRPALSKTINRGERVAKEKNIKLLS
jgi:putative transposase